MDLISPYQSTPTTASSTSTSTGNTTTASQEQKNAFLSAMTKALNGKGLLADAGGDDDNDDGSSLKVQIGS